MILGTLGSDKSVTTINAIMTEIFTGIKPDEIRIYREEGDSKLNLSENLRYVLNLLGINSRIKEIVIGNKISDWMNKMKDEKIDVLDVTPGRKYMAIISTNYSQAEEVRYAYLKDERRGYHVFGYVSPSEIKLINIRNGKEISYDPPLTVKDEDEISTLDREGLLALYNLLSLFGKVDILVGGESLNDIDDEYVQTCLTRSGFKEYEEEKEIEEFANKNYYFIADTNVYIKLGHRLGYLTKGRLLASRSVYNELLNKTKNTQKETKTILFHLGMYSFSSLHKNPPVGEYSRSGDIPLIEEARKIKDNIADPIVLITADKQVSYVANSHMVKSIWLNTIRNGKGDYGELLFCLSYRREYMNSTDYTRKDVILQLEDKEIVKLMPSSLGSGLTKVQTIDKKRNYAIMIKKLQEITRGK